MKSHLAITIPFLLIFSSCATVLNESPQTIPITSDPPGARVTIDGVEHGFTPVQVKLPVGKDHQITVEAANYPKRTLGVYSSVSIGFAILDIFCAVVPLIVDLYTGDIYNLDPGKLHFQFAPVKAPPPPPPEPEPTYSDSYSDSPAGGGGDSGGHCCLNKAYYSCPSAAAVAQCMPPQLPMCLMNCGIMDGGCPEQCLQSYPSDPSGCSREPARDQDC